MKPLPEAVWDISAARDGAAILVVQIRVAPRGAGVELQVEQASCSGRLSESLREDQVLRVLVGTLDATTRYYRDLLAQMSS